MNKLTNRPSSPKAPRKSLPKKKGEEVVDECVWYLKEQDLLGVWVAFVCFKLFPKEGVAKGGCKREERYWIKNYEKIKRWKINIKRALIPSVLWWKNNS